MVFNLRRNNCFSGNENFGLNVFQKTLSGRKRPTSSGSVSFKGAGVNIGPTAVALLHTEVTLWRTGVEVPGIAIVLLSVVIVLFTTVVVLLIVVVVLVCVGRVLWTAIVVLFFIDKLQDGCTVVVCGISKLSILKINKDLN